MNGWPFWHVTLTLAGTPVPEPVIRVGLERLSHDHPFLLSGRYGVDRAEVRYWEEGADATSVVGLALALWEEHRLTSGLPDWEVVGVEVVDRETFHRRGRVSHRPVSLVGVAPF
jgi:hypothetical protein